MFAGDGLATDAQGHGDNTLYKQLAVTQWLVCIPHHKPPFTQYSACVQLVRAWQLLNRLLRHESVADSERH